MTTRIASFAFALSLALLASTFAHAQPSLQVDPRTVAPSRPMPARTRLKLAGAGLGGGALALGLSAGAGFAVYAATHCGDGCDEDNPTDAGLGALLTGASLAYVTVPLASSAFVHMAGRRSGYHGRYGHALLGSGIGLTVGTGLSLATYLAIDAAFGRPDYHDDPATSIAIVSSATVGLLAVAGFGMLGYRLSDQRRVLLTPVLSPSADGRGLSTGLLGRF